MQRIALPLSSLALSGCGLFEGALTLDDAHPYISVSHHAGRVTIYVTAFGSVGMDCLEAPDGFEVTIQGQPAPIEDYGHDGWNCDARAYKMDLQHTTDPLEIVFRLGDEERRIRSDSALLERRITVPDQVVLGEPFVIGWEPASDVGTMLMHYESETAERFFSAAIPLAYERPFSDGAVEAVVPASLPEPVMTQVMDEGLDWLMFPYELSHEVELCEMGDCYLYVSLWGKLRAHLSVVAPTE